jgi:hypothetical protein
LRDYGKVFSRIWESADFRALSEDGRTLVLYLLTCQHGTIAGVFRVPDGYACEDLQWTPERVAEGFANVSAKGFATRCEATKWVWVAKFLEWNPPENPNQRKAASKVAQSVPDGCSWRLDFIRVCGSSLGIEPSAKANPSRTVPEPLPNQYQEQKQKQEEEASPQAAPQPDPKGSRLPADWILPDEWRAWAQKERADLDPDKVAESFRDFWVGKPGKDGRKADWFATWRNWIRSTKAAPGSVGVKSTVLAGAV